ncbi:MAG TPA: CpsD/CapB family tyrosine-protein kinase [Anaeromyxobacter sp.]
MMPAETLQATHPELQPEARLVALAAPDSAAAEQFRVLYQRILRLAVRRPLRVLAITSAGRREGRTTTAANLALTAAQDGRPTILVEADLRRPSLAKLLGLAPRAGLAEVLEGRAELGQAVTRLGPLALLAAGEAGDPGALLRGASAAALLDQLRAGWELVVLDAPPALAFADGDRVSGDADAALLVVRAGTTPRQVVRLALDALGDRAAGLVLNDVDADAVAHGRWIYPGEAPPPAAQ